MSTQLFIHSHNSMLDPNCIFCKIIDGSAPSIKVAEDEHSIAFMDIAPVSRGHCLVVPKSHYKKLHELPPDMMDAIGRMLIKVTRALEIEEYNVLQNNGAGAHQAVPHVHFHVIPSRPELSSESRLDLPLIWKTHNISQENLLSDAESIRSRTRTSVLPEMQSIDT